jgi:dTDP-4-dehydrorhamnose reductase
MAKILVTGASGLLGLNFCYQMFEDHQITGVINQNPLKGAPFGAIRADLSRPQTSLKLIEETKPDVILHCAAMANIDQCETRPDRAERINAEIPTELAYLTKKHGIKLLHISTDAVFDGNNGYYNENDKPNPLGVYAKTKLAGEDGVTSENPEAIIARVNFYGWSLNGKRSLSEFFFNNLSNNNPVMGFTDVYFCPLLVNDLVDVLWKMIEKNLQGIYHTVSGECLSKYEFGCRLADRFELDRNLIKPTSVSESGLQATRSPNLTMSTMKLASAISMPLPDQQQGIDRLNDLYHQGYAETIRSFNIE